MQWQTNLPLIAILRGITPEEALAHVGGGDRRRLRRR
ncbi:2-dehydro-3-deoxyphosphogluconate aldolase [Klebsiella michiganensis]|nr:2-dehydro-3-deoxyphosphogluconate aldolase [Klebsiella michiganensis]